MILRHLLLATLLTLQLATFCSSATVRISSKVTPPFTEADGDSDKKWHGFSIDVFKYCIEKGFVTDGTTTYDKYEVVTPPGTITGNGQGFSHLNSNQSDIYIAAPTMTFAREQIVDFTLPFFKTGLGVAVTVDDSQEKRTEAFFATLFDPATIDFLVGLIAVLWAVSCLVWCLEMVGNEEMRLKSKKFFNSNPLYGMAEALSWSFFTLVTPRSYKAPNHPVSKKLGSILNLLTVFFAATITSLITNAMLAQPNVQINSVKDIGDTSIIKLQGKIKGSSTADFLIAQGMTNTKEYPTFADALGGLKKGEIQALVYDKPMLQYQEKLQVSAVSGASETISDTNMQIKTLSLQFDPQEYGFVLKEDSSTTLKEKLGECVLRFAREGNLYENAYTKYFKSGGSLSTSAATGSPAGLWINICLFIFPTIIAYQVVKKLRNEKNEENHHEAIAEIKMKRLGLVNQNDLFELLCAVMEGQADIMDLIYRDATADETYDGKSLTMKDIFERQRRLLKAKEKVLNLRQNDDAVSEKKGKRVVALTSTLKRNILGKHAVVKVAWQRIKDKIKYDNVHQKQELQAFLDKAANGEYLTEVANKTDEAMKNAYEIWNKVKGSIDVDENESKEWTAEERAQNQFVEKVDNCILAIDHFFDILSDAHKRAKTRWSQVWAHTHSHVHGGKNLNHGEGETSPNFEIDIED